MRRRTRIAAGIYRDRYGIAATVKVGRVQREHRYPAGTDLDIIRSWQLRTRAELDEDRQQGPVGIAGTLSTDSARFIKRKIGRPAYGADRAHLAAWSTRFGQTVRSKLKPALVEDQIRRWHAAGVAARTIRHRCRLLRELYRALDGPRARTPVDHLKLPPIPRPRPIAVSHERIRAVAASLAKSPRAQKTYARYLIRATTGQRPAQIMRAKPDDIDYSRKLWFVRSAKGGNPIPFPLSDEAIAAWKLFAKVKAWGSFSTRQDARVLRNHGWPVDIKPYALRSTFAIDLLLNGADLGDLQGLLGHAQINTTRTHYAPVLAARLAPITQRRTLGLALPAVDCQPTTRNRKELRGKRRNRIRSQHAAKTKKSA